jgi:alpha-1,6-mannosyltransferase
MTAGRWRVPLLVAIGALMLLLTGMGLVLQRAQAHSAFVVLELAQGAIYAAAVGLTWRGGWPKRALIAVLAIAAVMRLGVVLAPPYLSDDANRYVWDGRVEAAGINPYRYIPVDPHLAALRDDKIFPNINRSTYAPTIYPPVAEYIFFIATRVSESLAGIKATMVAFEFVTVALLLGLLARLGQPRERILVYAWHPLLIWEFAGSGHIDAAAIAFVTLALWARQRESSWLTGVALAAAGLVKFFPAVIFPALYRRWDWKMPLAAAMAAIVAYLPFLGVGKAVLGFLPGYVGEEGLRNGSGFFLWDLATGLAPPLRGLGGGLYLALAAAALAGLAIYVALKKSKGADRYVDSAMVLAAAATVLASPHYAWYFAWLVPFLCFAPYPSILYLTVASPLLYFVPGGPDPHGARIAYEAAIYTPFAVLAAGEWWHRHAARVGASGIKVQA